MAGMPELQARMTANFDPVALRRRIVRAFVGLG